MKAFRGQLSIYNKEAGALKQAELAIEGLSLNFGGVLALDDIHLTVHTGELFAIIGPNGAGKTSLLNCITGFYRPQVGRITFNGENITHQPSHCSYGLLPASLFSASVRREEVRHRRILEEIIDFLEIQSLRNKTVGSLPYGMMKRVELGRALALEPALLVLDEPFAGMNLEEKEDMVRFMLELNNAWGQTMILVEHDMSIVMSIAERVAVLNFGKKLAEGSPEEIVRHPEVIKAYLGDTETA